MLARFSFGDFGDERFEAGLRCGDFNGAIGGVFDRENDLVFGITALSELHGVRGKRKVNRGGTNRERRCINREVIDIERRHWFAGKGRERRRVAAKLSAIEGDIELPGDAGRKRRGC